MSSRANMVQQMRQESRYDIIIIGGGITGCGVAYEAAGRGARVLLLERNDFAVGTSSRSTKLIHGGIRYLKQADFRLVREGVQERQDLIEAAPHLVHPMQFVYPVHEGDPDPLWALRIGLVLYDWFAGRRNLLPHRVFSPAGLLAEEPALRPDGLKGGALYADCLTDDARLTVEVAKAAARRGATLVNYMEVVRFVYDGQGRAVGVEAADRLDGGERNTFYANAILNATGPWADQVRRLDDPASRPVLRPTKGVHLAVPHARLPIGRPVVMHAADRRLMFAVPRDGMTYLGTTDTDYHEEPGGVLADRSDVTYILEAANRMFPGVRLTDGDVVSTWAGIRPLAAAGENAGPSRVSRDYRLIPSPSGLITVAGGKLTAFQAMARAIVSRVLPALRRDPVPLVLPGVALLPSRGETEDLGREYGIGAELVAELWGRHGSESRAILELARDSAGLPSRSRMLAAEAAFAVQEEFAVTLTDVLNRRTAQLLFSPDNGRGAMEAAGGAMGQALGWTEAEQRRQQEAYSREIAAMSSWRR